MHNTKSAIEFTVNPGGCLVGDIRVPGDKSISHRAIMLGALAEGTTQISGFLRGEDTLATLKAFRAMGVGITESDVNDITIEGVGMHGLQPPQINLDMGNSGTAMRLLSGLLVGQPFATTLVGDSSLSRRPMQRIIQPLQAMGANISANAAGTAPIRINPTQRLSGIDYALPVVSAQVKSCLLLAAMYAKGRTSLTEQRITRDHTERMLRGFGYPVTHNDKECNLQGGGKLTACDVDIPADISSAAFFIVGASIAAGSDVLLRHVGINPTRTGIIQIMRLMGANIDVLNSRTIGGEPVADLRVRSAKLRGIQIPKQQVPLAIDEFPAIFIAAACAEGQTVLSGAEELRVKESDRIQTMANGLIALGIDVQTTPDGIVIQGGQFLSGEIDSDGDHRIAMAFAMAALRATGTIKIRDCANVNTSFPNFVTLAKQTGLAIQAVDV